MVSVIMIFLNAEKFIREAIESVLAQTYREWELLLVDDGSVDGSTQIAMQYAREFPGQIRTLEHDGHQNQGMSASRNLGIRSSRGEYVAFLDADDVYLPQKLERQVAILDAQPGAGMVYGNTQYWFSWSGDFDEAQPDRMRTLGVPAGQLYQPPELFVRFFQNQARTPGTCSVLLRRETVEAVGGFEEQFRGMYEDQVFFFKVCLHAPVFVESGCWARYRQHPDSWCQIQMRKGEWDHGSRPTKSRAAFLEWLEAYLLEQKITDRRLFKTLRRELLPYRYPAFYPWTVLFTRLKQRIGLFKQNVLKNDR